MRNVDLSEHEAVLAACAVCHLARRLPWNSRSLVYGCMVGFRVCGFGGFIGLWL